MNQHYSNNYRIERVPYSASVNYSEETFEQCAPYFMFMEQAENEGF